MSALTKPLINHGYTDKIQDLEDELELTYAEEPYSPQHRHNRKFVTLLITSACSSSKKILLFLLPSFVARYIDPDPTPSTKKRSGIPALDGLRGLSCLGVVIYHYSGIATFANDSVPWNKRNFWQQPILNILWSGRMQVQIFFVLSGYVLSLKALTQLHKGDAQLKVYRTIASSALRRAVRIFIPPIAVLLLFFFIIRIHGFDAARAIRLKNAHFEVYAIRFGSTVPERDASLLVDLRKLLLGIIHLVLNRVLPSGRAMWAEYDEHMWTIPVEFSSSMALFLVLLTTAGLRPNYRLAIHVLLAVCCWLATYREIFTFVSGAVIAETDILLRAYHDMVNPAALTNEFLSSQHPPKHTQRSLLAKYSISVLRIFFVSIWVVSLWLMSMPNFDLAARVPGYRSIMKILPSWMMDNKLAQDMNYRVIAAVLFTWTVSHQTSFNPLRRMQQFLFANPVSVYFGDISFAIYLLHGFIERSIGYVVLPPIYNIVVPDPARQAAVRGHKDGNIWISPFTETDPSRLLTWWESSAIFTISFVCVILPCCVWLGDVFWRAVDIQAVRVAAWLERKLTVNE